MRNRPLLLVLLLVAFSASLIGQQPPDAELLPDKPAHNPQLATVTFQFELAGADPSHYALSIDATGRAAYNSTGPQDENSGFAAPGQQATGEPYSSKFLISRPTTDQIFSLAKRLNYFSGKFDYTKTRVANTGAKTLIYGDPDRHFETTFNWSQTPEIMELARMFQNISATLEFDRRLQDQMRHQKLALDQTLKELQDAAAHNNVAELRLLAPTLQKISSDSSFLHIARRRAQELLVTIPQ